MAAENTKRMLSVASKKASRVKEKLTKKLLHDDGTTDEGFSMFVSNYNKQQAAAKKLQKELLKYTTAIKGLSGAAKSLSEVLVEVYEPEWDGSAAFKDFAEQRNLLWEDLYNHLNSDVVNPVNDYLAKFPDVQKKIEKRDRKLTDHDITKRELEKMKTKDAAKGKGPDQKLQHAEEKHTQAKQLYDEITDELYKELPTLYDSRIEFMAKLYDSLSRHECQFHSQVSQVEEKVLQLMVKLAEEASSGVHSTKRERDAGPSSFSRPDYQDTTSEGGDSHSLADHKPGEGTITPMSSDTTVVTPGGGGGGEASPSTPVVQSPARSPSLGKMETSPKPAAPEPSIVQSSQVRPPKPTRVSTSSMGEQSSPDRNSTEIAAPPKSIPEVPKMVDESVEEVIADQIQESDHQIEAVQSPPPTAPSGEEKPAISEVEPVAPSDLHVHVPTEASTSPPADATTSNAAILGGSETVATPSDARPTNGEEGESQEDTPKGEEPGPTVLYKVVAAHPYKGEDEDELTFEKGDVIFVIPYDDPEDEEDGWKMGFLPNTNKKGIFPENFTKPFPSQ